MRLGSAEQKNKRGKLWSLLFQEEKVKGAEGACKKTQKKITLTKHISSTEIGLLFGIVMRRCFFVNVGFDAAPVEVVNEASLRLCARELVVDIEPNTPITSSSSLSLSSSELSSLNSSTTDLHPV